MSEEDNNKEQDETEESLIPRPYQGKYRQDLEKDDEDETTEQTDDEAATSAEDGPDEDNPDEDTSDDTHQEQRSPAERDQDSVWKQRYSDLRRHMNELTDQNKELKQQVENQVHANIELPKSKEDIDEWRKKYPEVYNIVATIASMQADEKSKKYESDLEKLRREQEGLVFERAMQQIQKAHPDFNDITQDDDFHSWAADQPQEVQDWLYNNTSDAKKAIRAVDMYKYDRGLHKPKSKNKTEENKDASKAVTKNKTGDGGKSKEPKIWTLAEIEKLTPAQYEKLEDEIDKAAAEGRIR